KQFPSSSRALGRRFQRSSGLRPCSLLSTCPRPGVPSVGVPASPPPGLPARHARPEIRGRGALVRQDGGVSRRPATRATPPGAARARPKPTSKPGGAKPPASRKRPATPEVEREDPRPPRQITVRTLVLAVVLLMAFVLITPTLRAYVRQQEELRELNTELAQAQEEAENL